MYSIIQQDTGLFFTRAGQSEYWSDDEGQAAVYDEYANASSQARAIEALQHIPCFVIPADNLCVSA